MDLMRLVFLSWSRCNFRHYIEINAILTIILRGRVGYEVTDNLYVKFLIKEFIKTELRISAFQHFRWLARHKLSTVDDVVKARRQ